MSYEGRDLVRAFFFGVRLAEHYHDIPYPLDKGQPDRFVHLLKTIAEGDFTLVDSPEEIEDQTDWHPQLREKLPEMLRAARTHHLTRTEFETLKSPAGRDSSVGRAPH
ncbi:MAG: hypothetical protein ACYS1B_05500 [Planctomycetota bacterium]